MLWFCLELEEEGGEDGEVMVKLSLEAESLRESPYLLPWTFLEQNLLFRTPRSAIWCALGMEILHLIEQSKGSGGYLMMKSTLATHPYWPKSHLLDCLVSLDKHCRVLQLYLWGSYKLQLEKSIQGPGYFSSQILCKFLFSWELLVDSGAWFELPLRPVLQRHSQYWCSPLALFAFYPPCVPRDGLMQSTSVDLQLPGIWPFLNPGLLTLSVVTLVFQPAHHSFQRRSYMLHGCSKGASSEQRVLAWVPPWK